MPSAYLTAVREMQEPGCWYNELRRLRLEVEAATTAGNFKEAHRVRDLLKSVQEMYQQRFGEPPDEERYA